ncbi:hypothetical protein CALVIDRAFT_525064 [Calocera viscosa TUFC12733]|uniref:N-acetyltransferase domain-containing protein n=1 Tax=Calocera viscosa (strain TUFC12733) TaxID=1330018 RepID=A0A167QRR0_CALVF|nr:hypothetical protein CALVIDRAFT_525064 [Calocera viscosa TUFC12733]
MSVGRPFNLLSSRLQFRRFVLGDAPSILAIRNDPNVLQFLPWWSPLRPEEGWNYVTRQTQSALGAPNVECHLAVIERQTSALIAICYLKVNSSGNQAEIGLMLGALWRGRGYEQEILRSIGIWAKAGSDGPGVERVTITIDARDTAVLAGSGAAGFAMVSQGIWAGQFPFYMAAM